MQMVRNGGGGCEISQRNFAVCRFTQSFNRINLKYRVVPKKPKKVIQDIIELISKSFSGLSGIVYCLSRRDCEIMAGELCKAGIAALCYHAGLSNDERCTFQQRWIQEDRCKVSRLQIDFSVLFCSCLAQV